MKRRSRAHILISGVVWATTLGLLCANAEAAPLKPALKAIDPTAAKMDTTTPEPPEASQPPNYRYTPYVPANNNFGASAAPAAYPVQNPGQPGYGGYAPQAGAPPASSVPYPPAAPAQYPPTYAQNQYAAAPTVPYSAPQAAYGAPANLNQYVPEFNKPLPQAPPSPYPASGPGFGSGYAAARQQQPTQTPEEQRVAHLEQIAFGSTYPEHEVDDRLEHLEREVFGNSNPGDPESRIARLEAKLGGGGAFGGRAGGSRQAQPPVRQPVVAQTPPPVYQQPVYQPPPVQRTYQPPPPMMQPPGAGMQPPYPPQGYAPQVVPPYGMQAPPAAVPNQQMPPYQPPTMQLPVQPQNGAPAHKAQPTRNNHSAASKSARPASPPATAMPAAPTAAEGNDKAASDYQVVVQSIPVQTKAGDYAASLQRFDSAYPHWTEFPVRVHIPMNTPDHWKAAIEGSISKWQHYLPMMVSSPQEPAEVEIAWINHLQPGQLGITNLEIFNGRMRVTVYLLRPTYYPPYVPESALTQVTLHEIGHALGVFGHSPQPGDVMHPVSDKSHGKQTAPSARDINTLRKLYEAPGLPPGFQSGQPISWP